MKELEINHMELIWSKENGIRRVLIIKFHVSLLNGRIFWQNLFQPLDHIISRLMVKIAPYEKITTLYSASFALEKLQQINAPSGNFSNLHILILTLL